MRRNGRVLLGVGLVGLGAWTVVPGMLHPISTEAVINAEVITLRAPVDGALAAAAPAVGETVAAGQSLARVIAFHPDSSRRDRLALELTASRRLVAALAEQAGTMAKLDRELDGRNRDYRTEAVRRLKLAAIEAAAKRAGAEAALARVQADLARKRSLLAKDIVAPTAVEVVAADERAAIATLDAAAAAARRAAAEADAAGRGIFVGDGFNNVPYAQQRRDEVRLLGAARKVEAAEAVVKVAELERQLAAEEDAVRGQSDAELKAPAEGVVWQRFAGAGEGVRQGDPVVGLVDCHALFLTAVLPNRFFAELGAGDRAQVTLAGLAAPVKAVVRSVRAAGNSTETTSVAVSPVAEEGRDVVVTLEIHDHHLGTRSDNLCQVGQRATVTFAAPALAPLVDAIAAHAMALVRHPV